MKVEGIRVVEINLNRAGTVYCLCWTPPGAVNALERLHGIRDAARCVVRRLGWHLRADGASAEVGEVRLLFETAESNLDRGLPHLLRAGDHHRLCLVQPGRAMRQAAGYVKGERADPPETHCGLFMGERSWAESMLETLSREAPAAVAHHRRAASLAEIAGRWPDTPRAVVEAYRCNAFSLKDIAEYFDMHFSEVSAIINASVR